MEFHGQGQTGYDPNKKKYVGTWVDSISPTIMIMEGDIVDISSYNEADVHNSIDAFIETLEAARR